MTADAFRAALAGLGHTQASFARFLAEHGHPAKDVARSVRRWAQIGPPAEVVVILRLMALRAGLTLSSRQREEVVAAPPAVR